MNEYSVPVNVTISKEFGEIQFYVEDIVNEACGKGSFELDDEVTGFDGPTTLTTSFWVKSKVLANNKEDARDEAVKDITQKFKEYKNATIEVEEIYATEDLDKIEVLDEYGSNMQKYEVTVIHTFKTKRTIIANGAIGALQTVEEMYLEDNDHSEFPVDYDNLVKVQAEAINETGTPITFLLKGE